MGGRAGSGVLRARAVPEMAREWPGVWFPGRGKEGLHALLERGCAGEGSREDPSVWGAGALAKGWETPSVMGGSAVHTLPLGVGPEIQQLHGNLQSVPSIDGGSLEESPGVWNPGPHIAHWLPHAGLCQAHSRWRGVEERLCH